MDQAHNMERVLAESAETTLLNAKQWLKGQAVHLAPMTYLLLPDNTFRGIPMETKSQERRRQEKIALQLLSWKMNVAGAITIEVSWAIDPSVVRSNFLVDLGRYKQIHRIPGYQETLVVSYVLPDKTGPAFRCSVIRDEQDVVTGFGETYRTNGLAEAYLLPWANIQVTEEMEKQLHDLMRNFKATADGRWSLH